MIITVDNQSIEFKLKEVKEENLTNKEFFDLIRSKFSVIDDSYTEYKSFNDLNIEMLFFDTFTEFVEISNVSRGLITPDTPLSIGRKMKEEVCRVKVDSLHNALVNISDYSPFAINVGEKDQGKKIERKGIKTYIYNASLESIANFFNEFSTDVLNSNVRDNTMVSTGKGDSSQFKETLEEYPENFYIYNNGITMITPYSLDGDIEKNVISITSPEIINGAQTLGKFLQYKTLNPKIDFNKVEVPLRIMVVSDEEDIQKISSDISAKINTQKPVVTDDLLYVKVKNLGLIDENNGLNVRKHNMAMREYLKIYTTTILKRPGSAKSSMKTILENSVNDVISYYHEEKDPVSLEELVENAIIFVDHKYTLHLEEQYNYINLIAEGKSSNQINSAQLHKIVNEKIRKIVERVEHSINANKVNTKYDQYIIATYFSVLSSEALKETRRELEHLNKNYISSDKHNVYYAFSRELITNNVSKTAEYILNTVIEAVQAFSITEEQLLSLFGPSIPKSKKLGEKKLIEGLSINDDRCEKLIKTMFAHDLVWDVFVKYKKSIDSKAANNVAEFVNYYEFTANTFKSNTLFNFLDEYVIKKAFEDYVETKSVNVKTILEEVFKR